MCAQSQLFMKIWSTLDIAPLQKHAIISSHPAVVQYYALLKHSWAFTIAIANIRPAVHGVAIFVASGFITKLLWEIALASAITELRAAHRLRFPGNPMRTTRAMHHMPSRV